MSENTFFKPTALYKEYMILDMIEKNANITQREMSNTVGIAVSMVNDYIDEYEKEGYITRKYHTSKTVEYLITKKGSERRKVLNIGYLKASQHLYNSARENIETFLFQIENKGFKNILLYGAGEVAEILLSSIQAKSRSQIEVLAVIDDDSSKQGTNINNTLIISRNELLNFTFDGILISSYINKLKMISNLKEFGFNLDKVINFFEI